MRPYDQPLPKDISMESSPATPATILSIKTEEQTTPSKSNNMHTWQAMPCCVHEESLTPPPLHFDSIDPPSPIIPIHEESLMPPWLSFNIDGEHLSPVHIQEESVTPPLLLFNDPVGSTQK
jgi:hypothetical protein